MRGKRTNKTAEVGVFRITPADAGKTGDVSAEGFGTEDHPRGCGENFYKVGLAAYDTGSPPRMRGKLLKSAENLLTNRITPADAGKTVGLLEDLAGAEDHPRGCGENTGLVMSGCAYPGSPPRMRGKPHRPKERGGTPGITPADAGKTILCRRVTVGYEDHPRGCGENSQFPAQISRASGSPPRMRGKRGLDRRRDPSGRITPADAGKT